MKKILILLGLLLAFSSVGAYEIPTGTFNVYETIGHYHKALVENNCIDSNEYLTNLDVYDLQIQYYEKYINCISKPKTEIIGHHKYNTDIVYYTNSVNESIWAPVKYYNFSWNLKIDRIEKKGEVIKFKFN